MDEYVRLRNEYHVTQRVLALVLEQLFEHIGGEILELTDEAVLNAPDLLAWRDDKRCVIGLQTKR